MTVEEDSLEQASNARREMLKALRAAKELSSKPDDPIVNEDRTEDSVDHGKKKLMVVEKESIEAKEMLWPLKEAKELSSIPGGGATQSGNNAEESGGTEEDKKLVVVEEESIEHAAAATRREMLRSLRMAKELSSTPGGGATQQSGNNADESEEDKGLKMKFRNYLPHDKKLQEGKLPPSVLPKFEDPLAAAPAIPEKIEDPFVNIAPKKPNWDLRRDVQKKLNKLERRTQKALYEYMLEQENAKKATEIENSATED